MLYRGDARELYSPQVGQSDRYDQFTSCTTDRGVAELFANRKWIFELRDVPSSHSALISHASAYPQETEVLLAPGLAFIVEAVDTSVTPHRVQLRCGGLGARPSPRPSSQECTWCELERGFTAASLVHSSKELTDFGHAVARAAVT